MEADVYWEGRLVGRLRNVVTEQPYYYGEWIPAGEPEFERAFRELQVTIASDGLGVLPVTFRSPDNSTSAPAAAMVRPAPETAPYFRFGAEGMSAGVVHEPTRMDQGGPTEAPAVGTQSNAVMKPRDAQKVIGAIASAVVTSLTFVLAVLGLPLALVVAVLFRRQLLRPRRPGKLGLEDVAGDFFRLSWICGLAMIPLFVLGLFLGR